jgi:ketosteroid isomerase-like protein
MRAITSWVLLALFVMSVSPVLAQNNQAVEKSARAVVAEHVRAWDARDIEAYMAGFGPPEGFFVVAGVSYAPESLKNQVQEWWKSRTNESWKADREQVVVFSDSAALVFSASTGRYTRVSSGVTVEEKIFETFFIRKVGDKWKIVSWQNSGTSRQLPK